MKTIENKNDSKRGYEQVGAEFFEEFWHESWTYIRTVVDVVRDPVILLDKECTVLAANQSFYELFQVKPIDTEGKTIYELGNGQWDIPSLKKLLVEILPKNTYFKGYEVEHDFPHIGHRTMILNARHIHAQDKTTTDLFPPIIMIAMEDVSEIMSIASRLAQYTNNLEKTLTTRTEKLELKIASLEKTIQSKKK